MFELFLTYWFSWILFIIIMFFVEKNKLKFLLLISLLVMLIVFPIKVMILSTEIYIVTIIMFFFAIVLYVYEKVTLYRMMTTFTMVLCYVGLLFWEKIAPIWFFIPSFFIVSIIIVIIAILLQRNIYEQYTSILLSVLFAQILFDLFLKMYFMYNVLSNDAILVIVTSSLLLVAIYVFRESFQKVFIH